MSNTIYLTQEGCDRLNEELDQLKRRRRELSDVIENARQEGDLSENAEYHAARELQGHCQAKISDLEDKLGRSQIISSTDIDTSKVRIGVKVTLLDEDIDDEFFYTIMSDEEANIDNDEIGISSPLVQAMLGKAAGETFEFQAPRGVFEYKIVSISLP